MEKKEHRGETTWNFQKGFSIMNNESEFKKILFGVIQDVVLLAQLGARERQVLFRLVHNEYSGDRFRTMEEWVYCLEEVR